jgi:hypothetical protein
VTIKQLFESEIPRLLRENPDQVKTLGGTISFELSGDLGGTWFLDPGRQPPLLEKRPSGVIDCTLRARAEDFQAMLDEPSMAVTLVKQGKIQVEGKPEIAARIHLLFR